jgi:hypothetical protein
MKPGHLLFAAVLLVSSAAFAADVTGSWQITILGTGPDGSVQTDTGIATLKQSGEVVTGTAGPDENRQSPISEGSLKDNKVVIKISPRPDRTMTFELTISGEKLVGTVSRTGESRTANVEFVRTPKK